MLKILRYLDAMLADIYDDSPEKYDSFMCVNFAIETISIGLETNKVLLTALLQNNYASA